MKFLRVHVHVLLLCLFIAFLFASTPTEATRLLTLSLGFAQDTPSHEVTLEVSNLMRPRPRPRPRPRHVPPPPPPPGYSPEPGPGHDLGSPPRPFLLVPAANSESLNLNRSPLNPFAASA
ncbi:hypothetical protein Fmac_020117 [Flemingia macrophylla]|uniref:Uncharacterized protein n=1 Tax=Flemingia macrophylla TaxID=520843 RepID=A0ABD1M9U0_9FABA